MTDLQSFYDRGQSDYKAGRSYDPPDGHTVEQGCAYYAGWIAVGGPEPEFEDDE